MRLLDVKTYQLVEYFEPEIPPYAILSHRWQAGEVLFADIGIPNWGGKPGARKIVRACQQAAEDALPYIWIDTCCIDKSSSAELSEAINSMFRWYAEAEVCYAFLSDVRSTQVDGDLYGPLRSQLARSAWFTRGWTLQELIAPKNVIFFDIDWLYIGSRSSLSAEISQTCVVDTRLLVDRHKHDRVDIMLKGYSIAQKMSWAAKRRTTRMEDRAYSLIGLFGVNMPLLYGEGTRAFRRLQEELLKSGNDLSILAWSGRYSYIEYSPLFAESPDDFAGCSGIVRSHSSSSSYALTNAGLRIEKPLLSEFEPDEKDVCSVALSLGCKEQAAITKTISLDLRKAEFGENLFDIWQRYSNTAIGTLNRRYILTDIDDPRTSDFTPFLTIGIDDGTAFNGQHEPIPAKYTHVWIKLPGVARKMGWEIQAASPERCWNSTESCFDISIFTSPKQSGSLLLSRYGKEQFSIHFIHQTESLGFGDYIQAVAFGIINSGSTLPPLTDISDYESLGRIGKTQLRSDCYCLGRWRSLLQEKSANVTLVLELLFLQRSDGDSELFTILSRPSVETKSSKAVMKDLLHGSQHVALINNDIDLLQHHGSEFTLSGLVELKRCL